MIALSDHLLATGATLTFHYTHPARTVAMQITLALRLDFTSPSPDRLMRASVFFTGYVANGQAVSLVDAVHGAPPQFRAAGVSEVSGELIADNCEIVAVVTQVDQVGTTAPGYGEAIEVVTVAFAQRPGGPPIYTHVVKSWPGGRRIGQQEARDEAQAKAQALSIDISQAVVTVTNRVETS